MTIRFILAAPLALCACLPAPEPAPKPFTEFTPGQTEPNDAAPGTCWDKTVTPAVVKTVTEDVLVQPAQISSTGTVQSPPVYRSQTHDVIVQERKNTWFQVVCAQDLTTEFVSSVQRALELRGHYTGPITGEIGPLTRAAVAKFQTEADIPAADMGRLTIDGARKLGLWSTLPQET